MRSGHRKGLGEQAETLRFARGGRREPLDVSGPAAAAQNVACGRERPEQKGEMSYPDGAPGSVLLPEGHVGLATA